MAKKVLEYFDVKRRLEDTPWTRSVNLMCHILRGINYGQLYKQKIFVSRGNNLFSSLRKNLQHWPDELNVDADGEEFRVVDKLYPVFTDIENEIDLYYRTANPSQITLGELFYTPRNNSPAGGSADELRNYIVDSLDGIYRTIPNTRMRHFCAPFVEIQKGRAQPCSKKSMDDFLDEFEGNELRHFFTAHGSIGRRKKVKAATDAGILRAKPVNASVKIHDGNGKWCCDSKCTDSNDSETWCLDVTIGSTTACALGSDLDPDCIPTTGAKKKVSKSGKPLPRR